jgi:putative SOS response-associated peptidase YedK
MCGRFTQKYTWRELAELYALTQPPRNLQPRYNIAPTTMIDVVRVRDNARERPHAMGSDSGLVEEGNQGPAGDL